MYNYNIRIATKQVLEIDDIVVKEIQKNISWKGGWLKKNREGILCCGTNHGKWEYTIKELEQE